MNDPYSRVPGKCVWWREMPNAEDWSNPNVKPAEKRVGCSCFIEGFQWTFVTAEIPAECPKSRSCRYFVSGR